MGSQFASSLQKSAQSLMIELFESLCKAPGPIGDRYLTERTVVVADPLGIIEVQLARKLPDVLMGALQGQMLR